MINGLPILIDTYALDRYYRDKVISGPDAFLEIAHDYNDFSRAFLRKLRREITPSISQRNPTPRPPVPASSCGLAGRPLRVACAILPEAALDRSSANAYATAKARI